MRFYGQSFEYWMNQDTCTISEAVQVLESLEAREDLRMLDLTTFANLKKETQSKISSSLHKRANPDKELKPISMAELAKMLGPMNGR